MPIEREGVAILLSLRGVLSLINAIKACADWYLRQHAALSALRILQHRSLTFAVCEV